MATKINTPVPYSEYATFSFTTDLVAPYKYQWKRNGENLVHGNNKSYTTPPLRLEDFKAKYSVQVFGQDKIESSDEVVLNDKMTSLTITDADKGIPAKNVTVIPPVKFAGPERRLHSGALPKGMAERRKRPVPAVQPAAVHLAPPFMASTERRIHAGVSPTGVERREL